MASKKDAPTGGARSSCNLGDEVPEIKANEQLPRFAPRDFQQEKRPAEAGRSLTPLLPESVDPLVPER
jgi:hypothetical protein